MPLRNHRFALPAALAAMAAGEQGKFWQYHDLLYANYKGINEELIERVARDLELDMEKFQHDRKDPRLMEQVRADVGLARELEVRGTPTVFIGGRLIENKSPENFKTVIDTLLAKEN